jgi:2-polyprenyl-3-methyl-5-hydroxy-6-metoxy-1,4-benzoquinol methylase
MACLFCSSHTVRQSYYPPFMFNKKEFRYVSCGECGLVYLQPLLNNDDLSVLYSLSYHNEFYFHQPKQYNKQLDLLKKYGLKGKLLDYGCGDGSFLKFFEGRGYELFGAEYNPELVEVLSKQNPSVRFQTIEHLLSEDGESYDIIHLGDVLEHLVNPLEIVEALKRKLTPNGVLFVEGPIEHNASIAYASRAGYFKLRKTIQPGRVVEMNPYHIFFSNRQNQRAFFERSGFKKLHYDVYEWAWPYPETWAEAKSLGRKLMFLIGRVSVYASSLVPAWGSRFNYIGRL